MTLFESLLLGHLIGDFLLQTRWMADNKPNHFLPLLIHSLIYAGAIYLASMFVGGISLLSLGIIFFSHLLLDQRSLTAWWLDKVSGSPGLVWMQFAIDQVFHVVFLASVVILSTYGY